MAAAIAAGGAIVVGGLLILIRRVGGTKDLSKVPGPKGLPVVGNALQLLGPDLHRKLAQWAVEYGGIFQFNALGNVSLYVTDLEALAKIVQPPPEGGLPKNLTVYSAMNNLTSAQSHPSVMSYPDYDHWRAIRTSLDPAFTPNVLSDVFPVIHKELEKVIGQIAAGSSFVYDVSDIAARLCLNMTGKFAYNKDLGLTNLSERAPLLEALRRARVVETNKAKAPILKFINSIPLLPGNRQHAQDLKTIHKAFEGGADSVRATTCPFAGSKPPTIPCALKDLKDEKTGQPVSRPEQNSNVALMGIAGSFPAAYIAAYSLFEIAAHPEILAKVEAELTQYGLLGRPSAFTVGVIDKLKYLDGCVKEGVRFHNVVPQVNRVTEAEYEICGYKIPKGIPVFIGIAGVHKSPNNYMDPNKYWPERWQYTEEQVAAEFGKDGSTATPIGNIKNIQGSFIPFSTGNRICIGKHVAWLQAKTIVAQLISAFKITVDPSTGNQQKVIDEEMYAITINPSNPINLVFTPRT